MGRIQSSIGLITGVPILDTVDKLMAISGRPRDLLVSRNSQLQEQRVAVTQLTGLVVGLRAAMDRLKTDDVFRVKTVTSQDSSLLSAAITGDPTEGSFPFTPIRRAQSHQLVSSGFASADDPIGQGSFSFRYGGFVDDGIDLEELRGGLGVESGKIRITDRSGASATVDLRFAKTVDDVLQAINASDGINVTATVDGDAFRLIDNTGQTAANLRVQDYGLGTTASDLGLATIDVAASEATGQDVLSLHDNLRLSRINDGNGLSIRAALPDLQVTFRDGSSPLQIDFHHEAEPEGNAAATTNALNGVNAQVTFTALQKGEAYDDVTIRFVDTGSVTKGSETVIYDNSDPDNKSLIFDIESGQTDADDIVSALAGEPSLAALFSATAGGDGSGAIDLTDTATTTGGAAVSAHNDTTLGELLATINAADPTRLQAEISGDGDTLVLTDLTAGGGTFSVSSPVGSTAAEELGLTGAAVGGVITSRRLQAGLKTSLLSSLNGGQGLQLGDLALTDRNGDSQTVDLASAATLDDVVRIINNATVGIVAEVNSARNGIQLTDTTGASASNLIVANADATNAADALDIAVNDATTSVVGGSLDLQVLSRSTRLESFNGGAGVASGSFLITDSAGDTGAVNLALLAPETVGDVIDAINDLDIGVTAQINDAGDGIQLIDTAGGVGTLRVEESGNGTAATDLHLQGTATYVDIDGTPTQVIDGSTTFTVSIDVNDTLDDLIGKVNSLNAGVHASRLALGSGSQPYRLSLQSETTGRAGRLLIDASDAGFAFHEVSAGQDALLLYGTSDSGDGGILASSATNTFDELLDGVELTVNGTSTVPVHVDVTTSDTELVSRIQGFVDAFNSLRDRLDEWTFFNEEEATTGILFGSNEALRVETGLADLLSGRFYGVGDMRSLEEVGLSLDRDGHMSLDKEQLQAKFAEAPEAVEEFFTSEELGVAAKLETLVEQLAGEESSLLTSRADSLQRTVDANAARIEFMNQRLERERELLLNQFYMMEEVVARMQSQMSAIQSITALPPLTSTSKTNS